MTSLAAVCKHAEVLEQLPPFQRRVVNASVACVGSAVVLGFAYLIFLGLRAFVSSYAHVIWPLAVSGVGALLLRPWVNRLESRLGGRRALAVALIYTVAAVIALSALLLIAPPVLREGISLLDAAPGYLTRAQAFIVERYPGLTARMGDELSIEVIGHDLIAQLREGSWMSASGPALQRLQSGVGQALTLLTASAIVPVYLYFFLLGEGQPMDAVERQLGFLRPQLREDVLFLMREFMDCVVVFFRGQIIIGTLMGVLLALGFTLVGLKFGLVIGLVIGALNIIPYLGTILGLSTAIPVALLQAGGGTTVAVACLVVFVIVQLIEGYLLTPRIMGEATGLHPMVIIVAIFFWGTALEGILGMIFAIPLTAFGVVAWRLFRVRVLVPLLGADSSAADAPSAEST